MFMERSDSCLKKRTSESPPTPNSTHGICEPTFFKFLTLFQNHALENQHNRWAIELRPFGPEYKKQIPPEDKTSSTSTLHHPTMQLTDRRDL